MAHRNFPDLALCNILGSVRAMKTAVERLRHAREMAGFRTALEFSEKHGIKQSTYAHHEAGSRPITRAARRYAKLLKVSLDWLQEGIGPGPTPTICNDKLLVIVKVPLIPKVSGWLPGENNSINEILFVPVARVFEHTDLFALALGDASMDIAYPAGSYVVCARVEDLRTSPAPGERVIAERELNGATETIVRELREEPDGSRWLWPRSSRPELQATLALQLEPGPADWRLVAVVVGGFRAERQSL